MKGNRARQCEEGLPAFRQAASNLRVVKKPLFQEADQTIIIGITGIADVVTRNGLLGVDLARLKGGLGKGGIAHIGYASASGKGRARQAAERAILSPGFAAGHEATMLHV